MRKEDNKVADHNSVEFGTANKQSLANKRYSLVPLTDPRVPKSIPEADWRLLPNIVVTLDDGSQTDLL